MGTGVKVIFKDPPTFTIGYCAQETEFVIKNATTPRIWTFQKSTKSIVLVCNGREVVFNIDYTTSTLPHCGNMWSSDFEYMIFRNVLAETDNASDLIRKYTSGMKVFKFYSHF